MGPKRQSISIIQPCRVNTHYSPAASFKDYLNGLSGFVPAVPACSLRRLWTTDRPLLLRLDNPSRHSLHCANDWDPNLLWLILGRVPMHYGLCAHFPPATCSKSLRGKRPLPSWVRSWSCDLRRTKFAKVGIARSGSLLGGLSVVRILGIFAMYRFGAYLRSQNEFGVA